MTAGLRPSDARLHIFRCALMPVDYSMVDKVPEDKNHYVALCKPKDNASDPTSIQEFVMMPVVPDYDLTTPLAKKLSQVNLTLPSSVSQPSCVSQPKPSSIYQTSPGCKPTFVPKSSSGTQKVKKGKLYLMNYLPKKESSPNIVMKKEHKYAMNNQRNA